MTNELYSNVNIDVVISARRNFVLYLENENSRYAYLIMQQTCQKLSY